MGSNRSYSSAKNYGSFDDKDTKEENQPRSISRWGWVSLLLLTTAAFVSLLRISSRQNLEERSSFVSSRSFAQDKSVAPLLGSARSGDQKHNCAMATPGTDDSGIVVSGFKSNFYSAENPSGKLHWFCAPDSWKDIPPNSREGRGGQWQLAANGALVLTPPAKKDFWRKTYYDPILIKDDGPVLYAELDVSKFYTIETSFVLKAVRQFDQAGLVIRLGPEHWLKTGIEVVDQRPRLSCVVTNVYSDWSTQAWSNYAVESDNSVKVRCSIRVHVRGTSFVVEGKLPGGDWEFIRIAHLSPCMMCKKDPLAQCKSWTGPAPASGKIWAGVFAASPEDQQGGFATFSSFEIKHGSHFEHNADGNQEN